MEELGLLSFPRPRKMVAAGMGGSGSSEPTDILLPLCACLVSRGKFRAQGCLGSCRDGILFPHRVLYSASTSGILHHVRFNLKKYGSECRMVSMLACLVVNMSIHYHSHSSICVSECPQAPRKLSSLSTYPSHIPT